MKRVVAMLLVAVMLSGCGNANSEAINPQQNTVTEGISLSQNIETDKEGKETVELKACFGTITKIDDGKIYIEGVNDVLYVGSTELLGNLKVDDFVYFEYSTGEKKDNEYDVEFTILKYEDRDPNSKKLVN